MINLVDYYVHQLGGDLRAVSADARGRLSIVAFASPRRRGRGPTVLPLFGAWPDERRLAFLLGYQFCVLLDQAIHSGARRHHQVFDDVARYPKLGGILGSYYTNMHPALLLGVASGLVSQGAVDGATDQLRRLSRHVIVEYARFLTEDFADLVQVARGQAAHLHLLKPVFEALSSAYGTVRRPAATEGSFPFSVAARRPNAEVYERWCDVVQSDIHTVGEEVGAF